MHAGLISDQNIRLTGTLVSRDYPEMMRMVVYEDFVTNNVYRFLTNNEECGLCTDMDCCL